MPSTGGGANWSGAAVDPETGLLYVPSVNAFSVRNYRDPEPGEGATLNIIELRGEGTRTPTMPQGLPLFKPPYSRMTAIDLNTGDHTWMTPLGAGDLRPTAAGRLKLINSVRARSRIYQRRSTVSRSQLDEIVCACFP